MYDVITSFCFSLGIIACSNRAINSLLTFGCLNIQSLSNKLDNVIELQRDRRIDHLRLTESWHHPNSSVLGRLWCTGYNVVDQALPSRTTDDLSVNHGGIVVVAVSDLVLSPLSSLSDHAANYV
jgi:hypothetical protein